MMRDKILAVCRRAVTWIRGRTLAEGFRTLLLIVLAAGVVVQSGMLWSNVLTRESIPWSGLHARLNASGRAEIGIYNSASAMPVRFAARSEKGLYGTQYNTEGLRTAYEETADVWAQALGNAAKPTEAKTSDYRAALQSSNLMMMEYDGRIPLYIIAGWLDCSIQEELKDCELRTMTLCEIKDNRYALYLRSSGDGGLLSAETTVSDNEFDAAVELFEPNDCVLAAEEDTIAVSPDLLYFENTQVFDVLTFRAYTDRSNVDELLEVFGLRITAGKGLHDVDDTQVYVSGTNKIQLTSDGMMQYDGTSVRLPVLSYGDNRLMECVQVGYDLTNASLEAIGCSDSAALTDAYTDTDTGRYIVVYGIQANGIPIDNSVTGYFARYEFEGNTMVHANLALRISETTGEQIAVMPERQVAASLTESVDALTSVRYVDNAKGTKNSWTQLDADLWDAENSGVTEDTESTVEQSEPKWYILNYEKRSVTEDTDEAADEQGSAAHLIQGGNAV